MPLLDFFSRGSRLFYDNNALACFLFLSADVEAAAAATLLKHRASTELTVTAPVFLYALAE